jgi:hypothetical protein
MFRGMYYNTSQIETSEVIIQPDDTVQPDGVIIQTDDNVNVIILPNERTHDQGNIIIQQENVMD